MRKRVPPRLSLALPLLSIIAVLLVSPAVARTTPDSTRAYHLPDSLAVPTAPDSAATPTGSGLSVPIPDTHGKQYLRGQKTARKKAFFPGTFSAGFLVGMSAPVASIAAGSGVGDVSDGNDALAAVTAVSCASLWILGGKWLISQPEIKAAKRYRKGLSGQDLADFDAGYTNVARKKRSVAYTVGVTSGVVFDATVVGMFIAALSTADFGYGPAD